MDEKKQIEEMAKVIIKAGESYYKMPVDIECANREAGELYVAGYRKADEVIDRLMNAKTTSGLTEKEIEFFVKHNEKVRKETAKEILDEVSRHFGGAWLAELYKKYGVQ